MWMSSSVLMMNVSARGHLGQFSGNGGVVILPPGLLRLRHNGSMRTLPTKKPEASRDFPLGSDARSGLLLTGRELLGVAEVKETVLVAEIDSNAIGTALAIRFDPLVVERHRFPALEAVHRDRLVAQGRTHLGRDPSSTSPACPIGPWSIRENPLGIFFP
jgi:hypothetical protein